MGIQKHIMHHKNVPIDKMDSMDLQLCDDFSFLYNGSQKLINLPYSRIFFHEN